MKFIGIDPGKNGGMGTIGTDHLLLVLAYTSWQFAHMTETDIVSAIRHATSTSGQESVFVLVEKQGTRPTDARPNIGKLHHQWGIIRGCLLTLPISFEDIAPAMWQKTFKLLMKGGTPHTVKKNIHKQRAQQLFPQEKITHGNADALLIAEYGRQMYLRDGR